MRITLYIINWNDSFYLPFLAKHYSAFCQRMVCYDNISDDGSQELAKSLGFEVRTFGFTNHLDDEGYLQIKNHCWKECRTTDLQADYVIICDADEFILPDNLVGTCPRVFGYNMISESLPVNDIFEIKTGAPSESYSKQAIFSPNHVEEINFVHGCHQNRKTGLITDSGNCRLLHYRQIGGLQRMIDRHKIYRGRMSNFNLKHGMGIHYLHTDEEKRIEWESLQSNARELW